MSRQQITIGIVGVIVGFILGFFVSQGYQYRVGNPDVVTGVESAETGLPENHPSPQLMQRLQQLQEQVGNDPNDVTSRIELGNAYYDMDRYDAAIPWYEEALKLDPNNVHVSTDLGTAYLYMGNAEKAMERYQKSLLIEPNHPQTLQNMGIAQFSSNNFQAAIDFWERLLEAHPDYPHAEELEKQLQTARMHLNQDPSPQ